MKSLKYLQLGFAILFGTGILVNGPSFFKNSEDKYISANSMDYYNSRPDLYRNRYRPVIRRTPTVIYKVEATITVKSSSNEQITDISIDGNVLDSGTKKGRRQTYTYLVGSGQHTISWTVKYKNGQSKDFNKSFYVDAESRSVKLTIDGEEFYQK